MKQININKQINSRNTAVVLISLLLTACGGGGAAGNSGTATVQLAAVAALYPTNGAKWNDYVKGSNWLTATDVACNSATDTACLHGGERRVVVATGKTSCTGLTATDDLGAFNWVCDASVSPVRLVSTRLAGGKHLSDLLDFDTPSFKANKVTVYSDGAAWGVTPDSSWWSNPVVISNAGGYVDSASTIYLATTNPAIAYLLAGSTQKVALVVKPGITLSGPGTNFRVVEMSGGDYLWFEGSIDATGETDGITIGNGVKFNRLHGVTVKNALSSGIHLAPSTTRIALTDITSKNNNSYGVRLDGASHNTFENLNASNNIVGLGLVNSSSNNNFTNTALAYSNYRGLSVDGGSSHNAFAGLRIDNSDGEAIYVAGSSNNNAFSNVTAVGNGSTGTSMVSINGSVNTILQAVTAGNSLNTGIRLSNGSNNAAISALASISNRQFGIAISSNNNTFADIAAGYSNGSIGEGINISSNYNTFTGLLRFGNNIFNCNVYGTNPGLADSTCANNGSSNAALTTNTDLASSFVGKVSSDDAQNAGDTNGSADFSLITPATFDWLHFNNSYRTWGIESAASFPGADQRGRWNAGIGRIYDWSLSAADSGNGGSPALLGVIPLPTGSNFIVHKWDASAAATPPTNTTACEAIVPGSRWSFILSSCFTNYLRGAIEIAGDDIGNDNGLCESNETCLYTPNIGSYQGSGSLVSAGVFTGGTITGVTLLKFETNGTPNVLEGGAVISL